MTILDSYAHVALPRFMSADEFVRIMDENGVEKAHVCTAETCPDLAELSRAAVAQNSRTSRPISRKDVRLSNQ